MAVSKTSINEFEKLDVWQRTQDAAVLVYKLAGKFPADERYSLTSQIKRAVASISANIAEGFGRQSEKEKIQFYSVAYGSLLETKNHLYLAVKLGFIDQQELQDALEQLTICQKQLASLIKVIKDARN